MLQRAGNDNLSRNTDRVRFEIVLGGFASGIIVQCRPQESSGRCGGKSPLCQNWHWTRMAVYYFFSDGNISRKKRSVNDAPSSIYRAKFRANPNHTYLCKAPRRSCKRIEPSSVSGCFVAVRRDKRFLGFLRFVHSFETISNRIRFLPATVSRRRTDVCIAVVEIPFDNRGLYFGLDVKATSDGVGENSRGSQ